MNELYDYKRFAILYVDDEERSLKQFSRVFSETFRVMTAPNAAEGYKLLEDHQDEIAVVMSDQRMPGEQGVQFLERARRLRPQIIRILVTAYADLDAAIAAVNSGAIYKYVSKPWEVPMLEMTLKRGLEFFAVQLERDLLLREKLSVLHRLVVTDRVLSLGVLGAGLGHQLRNAVASVRQFLELVPDGLRREDVDLNQLRNPDFWQDFHRNVQARFKTVVGLLDSLVIPVPPPYTFNQEVSLPQAIDRAAAGLAVELRARKIEVVNAVAGDLPVLKVDGCRFEKLFPLILRYELLSLSPGSLVRFEATAPPPGGAGPAAIELFVTDTGSRLAAEAALALLDPFQMRRSEAGELGTHLLAVYLIVHHHSGTISVGQSASGGLAMKIRLPTEPKPPTPADEEAEFLSRAMTSERLWESLLDHASPG
ncbi:MAG: response regulator [Verrucomicrobia bacterium]|nr:response regulator [Verrucomicrobiota bacterium]